MKEVLYDHLARQPFDPLGLFIRYKATKISFQTFVYMVVAVGISSHLHQNFFLCDVDLLVVSFYFAPTRGYPLRVGELVIDARCDVPLLEP